MCLALAIAGGLFSAAGAVMAGQAQARAYEAQANVANQNARMAQMAGSEELKRGAREEAGFRERARQFQAAQRTALAASGAQLSGSSLNVLTDTAQGIENDATTMRYGTLQRKWGYNASAVNFTNQAAAARSAAKNASTAGGIGGLSGLLSTAGTVAGMTPKTGTGSIVKNGTITVGAMDTPSAWGRNFAEMGGRSLSGWERSYNRMKRPWGF
jgi:hypothetical protein